jgi:hypothetical protein
MHGETCQNWARTRSAAVPAAPTRTSGGSDLYFLYYSWCASVLRTVRVRFLVCAVVSVGHSCIFFLRNECIAALESLGLISLFYPENLVLISWFASVKFKDDVSLQFARTVKCYAGRVLCSFYVQHCSSNYLYYSIQYIFKNIQIAFGSLIKCGSTVHIVHYSKLLLLK